MTAEPPLRFDETVLDPYRKELGRTDAPRKRIAFAAAHLVLRADAPDTGGLPREELAEHIDWEATRAIRRFLDERGFGIAEAMDTAQRFSIGWPNARRLIEECGKLAPERGWIAGAGADQRDTIDSTGQLVDAVVEQGRLIQAAGGWVILLPHPWLCEVQAGEEIFVEVYREIVRELDGPLFVHWLGEAFHRGLRGYFPGASFTRIMGLDPEKVRGCKLSLLDAEREIAIRRSLLPREQIVLTGDDFSFGSLILGGCAEAPVQGSTRMGEVEVPLGDFSHALLGILDGIAEPAGLALRLLDQGRADLFVQLMAPCEELGRWIFQEPTSLYKCGLAFLHWLNGTQDSFRLVDEEERRRSPAYYRETARLASLAGVISRADTAGARWDEFRNLTWVR